MSITLETPLETANDALQETQVVATNYQERQPKLDFDQSDIQEFTEQDEEAGRRIGKILATLFVYTIAATGIAIWWTVAVTSK